LAKFCGELGSTIVRSDLFLVEDSLSFWPDGLYMHPAPDNAKGLQPDNLGEPWSTVVKRLTQCYV
jgi:hypothetical protein